jgi:hypothetical protein
LGQISLPAIVAEMYETLSTSTNPDAWRRLASNAESVARASELFSPGVTELALRLERSEHEAASAHRMLSSSIADRERRQQAVERIGTRVEEAAPLLQQFARQLASQQEHLVPVVNRQSQQMVQWRAELKAIALRADRQQPAIESLLGEVESLRTTLESQSVTFAALASEQVAQLRQQQQRMNRQLQDRDAELALARDEIRKQALLERGLRVDLAAREKALVGLRENILARDEALSGLRKHVATAHKDAELDRAHFLSLEAELRASIQQLEDLLAQHEAELAALREDSHEQSQRIAHLLVELQRRADAEARLQRRVDATWERLQAAEARNLALLDSTSWRMTRPLRRMRSWLAGRPYLDPTRDFDPEWYLQRYPDVAASGMDPLEHYLSAGHAEGRLALPPPPAVTVASEQAAALAGSTLSESAAPVDFDPEFYLRQYPDIAAAGLDPYAHYLAHGRAEGRHGARPVLHTAAMSWWW